MIFFFKKKPIVLHCVTDRKEVLTYAPVQRTNKFLPKWWHSLPSCEYVQSDFYPSINMRHCVGFTDLYRQGVTIPLWCDLALDISPIGYDSWKFQFSDQRSVIDSHPTNQFNNAYKNTEFQHIKLMSPWRFSCDEEIKFLFIEPTWSMIKIPTLRGLPGIVDFKYQNATNQNFFIVKTHEQQKFIVPFLTPLMQIVPLSDRPLKIILSDDIEMFKKYYLSGFMSTFLSKYKSNKKCLKDQGK